MNGRGAWLLGVLLGCSDAAQEEPSAEEIKERGVYCCTENGRATTPECERAAEGSIYLSDFSHVDAAGRGKACGWVLR